MKLFEKGKIGNVELKNRIVMTPMGTNADPDGGFMDKSAYYYAERAKGGVGLVITGYSAESETYEETTCTILDNFKKIGRANNVVNACHAYGTKVCMQLGPGLGRVAYIDKTTPPWSTGPEVSSFHDPNLKCKGLTKEDLAVIVKEVGNEAFIAKSSGADFVELRVYGGYLADQFMTSLWNHRTDEYGGSLENRMRFTMELIDEIRKTCGKDYPLIVKFNPYHGIEGGRQIEEGIEIAKMLEAKGVDALHLDKGCWDAWYHAITTVYQKDAHQLDMATEIKKVVNIPVISQGKMNNPVVAEKALEDGKLDFVGLGHQMLSDPEWANKVKDGKIKDIRPCIGCNECLRLLHSGMDISCAVNPGVFHETETLIKPAKTPRKVLVVGGGPGGMVAALTAQKCGHNVQLWEKSDRLGGLLLAAGGPDFKYSVMDYVRYLVREIDKAGIDVHYMTTATAEKIKSECFDHVIIASGADPLIPPVPGIHGPNVYESTDVLTGKSVLKGQNIVVLGGGLVGCETAAFLSENNEKVSIIEMLSDILVTAVHAINNDLGLKNLLSQCDLDIHVSTKALEIKEDCVVAENADGTFTIPCDAVVVATGYRANRSLADSLDGIVEYTIIGDNIKARKIYDAVHEGFNAARNLR